MPRPTGHASIPKRYADREPASNPSLSKPGLTDWIGLALAIRKIRKSNPNTLPTMKQAQLLGTIRHILTFAGGFAVAKGYVDQGTMLEIVGALSTVIGLVWSNVAKKDPA